MAFAMPMVVIDNGGYSMKAGFACDNHPVSIFRTVVGRPSYLQGSYGKEPYEVYIGEDALDHMEDYTMSFPLLKGRIVHWDNMERIWHHIFYRELKAAPEDRSVILTCGVTTPLKDKIKCCEIFFETLNAPALCVQSSAVLSMYGAGITTGLCVNLGHDNTEITPVYEGGSIKYAYCTTNLGGAQITNEIWQNLADRNYDFGIRASLIIDDIKTQLYVTPDCAMSRWNYKRNYTLPSGEEIDVSQEAFMTGELYFQPDFIKEETTPYTPLPKAIVTSAAKCDPELQDMFYDAIVCCGGISVMPGLLKRIEIEVENIVDKPVTLMTSPEAQTVSWLGGAVFASLQESRKLWVQKKQFEEYGEKIVRNKYNG